MRTDVWGHICSKRTTSTYWTSNTCSSTYRRCWVSSTRSSPSDDRLAPAFVLAVFRPFLSRPQRMTHARSLALPLCTSMTSMPLMRSLSLLASSDLCPINTPCPFSYIVSLNIRRCSPSHYTFLALFLSRAVARALGVCVRRQLFRLSILCVSRPSVSLFRSHFIISHRFPSPSLCLPLSISASLTLSRSALPLLQDMYQWYLMYARLWTVMPPVLLLDTPMIDA